MAEGDLIIGIGNTLRGDDGVGWWLAERAEGQQPAADGEAGRTIAGSAAVNGWPLVRTVQQLTPELVEELQTVRRVLFIDACWPPADDTSGQTATPGPAAMADTPEASGSALIGTQIWPSAERAVASIGPVLERLAPHDGSVEAGAFSHQFDPSQLLAIRALLHGWAPEAWRLLVPAWAMGHGEGFSPQLQGLLPQAEALLINWLAGGCDGGAPTAQLAELDSHRSAADA